MAKVVTGAAGLLAIDIAPLRLRFHRADRLALETGEATVIVRALGVEIPVDARFPAPDVVAAGADAAVLITLTIPERSAAATLTAEATVGGFRLTLIAPPGASAVGLSFRLAPAAPWYGGGERIVQFWPLDQGPAAGLPFIPTDFGDDGMLDIATPLWFGAGGAGAGDHPGPAVGILADSNGELEVTLNQGGDGLFRILSRPPYPRSLPGIDTIQDVVGPRLTVEVFLADDIPAAYRAVLPLIGRPVATPPAILFEQPIWTTWARYRMGIDQVTTLAFAADIVAHGFGRSVMEIDDRWQATYGELRFDPVKFPDPAAMVRTLHEAGFRVTLWVPPFFDPASPAFAEAAAHGFLVRQPVTNAPYLIRWWQGYGGLIDVSNPAALAWWLAGLRRLQVDDGVDGFKFDAGEAAFLPRDAITYAPIRRTDYTDLYVAFIGAHFPFSEVRSGYLSQRAPIFFRQWDKWSRWGRDNGLHACITQALALSLAGYPFILPDMIGGNAYDGEVPDRELLIRWAEMNALLPALQFSLPPWEADAEAATICRRYSELHTHLAPYLVALAAQAVRDGTPLIRPLFWHFPADRASYFVDDAFLLGDRYLAAPVVQPGARTRDVYLPPGRWSDYWTGVPYGGGLLKDYPASLDMLPLFEWLGA